MGTYQHCRASRHSSYHHRAFVHLSQSIAPTSTHQILSCQQAPIKLSSRLSALHQACVNRHQSSYYCTFVRCIKHHCISNCMFFLSSSSQPCALFFIIVKPAIVHSFYHCRASHHLLFHSPSTCHCTHSINVPSCAHIFSTNMPSLACKPLFLPISYPAINCSYYALLYQAPLQHCVIKHSTSSQDIGCFIQALRRQALCLQHLALWCSLSFFFGHCKLMLLSHHQSIVELLSVLLPHIVPQGAPSSSILAPSMCCFN